MSEKPIIFNGPMVRAIMDGRKTITRRIVKPQPPPETLEMRLHGDEWLPCWEDDDCAGCYVAHGDMGHRRRCPYGRPGDRLWVRETWATPMTEPCNRAERACPQFAYRAAGDCLYVSRWRPSIHMPRYASRITLEVVSVRAERLHDINEMDAMAEGAPAIAADDARIVPADILARLRDLHTPSYTLGFASVWMEINGPGSWDTNPWVWVIEFKRLEA